MTPMPAASSLSARVPGRVNLIGEWIDFNGGVVLPMTLDRHVTVGLIPNKTDKDMIRSAQFADQGAFPVDAPAAGHWSDYVRGALQYARNARWIAGGVDAEIASDIPVGAGLSSSAATIVATLRAASVGLSSVDPVSIAQAARKIENEFIGVPCGIMDQMAVALGRPGAALALDTRDCSYRLVDVPSDWVFAVIASGTRRALADGRYKERREECLAAAQALSVDLLCDADISAAVRLPANLAGRARHVIAEGARSRRAVDALSQGNRPAFGRLMSESHASLRDNMDVSVPAIDALVADALRLGADGARITGAGFGGCIVCLVEASRAAAWWEALSSRHPAAERIA